MKKIKTAVELVAFIVTVPILVMTEFNCPVLYSQPPKKLPVINVQPASQRSIAASPEQSMPALLNSKFIIINY